MGNSKEDPSLLTQGFLTPQEFQNINTIRFFNDFEKDISEEFNKVLNEDFWNNEAEKTRKGENSLFSAHKEALEKLIKDTTFGKIIMDYYSSRLPSSIETKTKTKTSLEGEASFSTRIIPLLSGIKGKMQGSTEKETTSSKEYVPNGFEIPAFGTWLITATLMVLPVNYIERISDKDDLLPIVRSEEGPELLNNLIQRLSKMKITLLKDALSICRDNKDNPSRRIDQLWVKSIEEALKDEDNDKMALRFIKQASNSLENDREKIEMALNFVILSKCYEIAAVRINRFLLENLAN